MALKDSWIDFIYIHLLLNLNWGENIYYNQAWNSTCNWGFWHIFEELYFSVA